MSGINWESKKWRLPPEWRGLIVDESEWHTKGAPPGFVAVSSREPNTTGRIAYFQRDQLEEASAEPLYADRVDEATSARLIRMGWTPPAVESLRSAGFEPGAVVDAVLRDDLGPSAGDRA